MTRPLTHTIFLAFLMLIAVSATAQDSKNEMLAKDKAVEAIRLMDEESKYTEAITLLEEAEKLDTNAYGYAYEIAYAYLHMKQYEQALSAMKRVMAFENINSTCYQQMGNIQDMMGDKDAALQTYAHGLKKFPNAGNLYLETGNAYLDAKKYDEAIENYEKGISVDPMYPSNYFRAAYLYLNSDEPIWGLIYGEIFMNLEKNSDRTEYISELMYEAYVQNIKWTSDTSLTYTFTKRGNIIDASDLKSKKFKHPFSSFVYEPLIAICVGLGGIGDKVHTVEYEELCAMRYCFTQMYFEQKKDKKYPNVLISYQKEIMDAGHLDVLQSLVTNGGEQSRISNILYHTQGRI